MGSYCEEIHDNIRKGNSETAYKLVKTKCGVRKKSHKVRDANGKILREDEDIENLYQGPKPLEGDLLKEESVTEDDDRDPEIMRSEFDRAMKDLKNNKATGVDKINGEIINVLGSNAKDTLFEIMKDIYGSGRLSEDFEKSVMIAIPKETRTDKCEEHNIEP
ncbi:uncharacterized protein [Hetaerina americana]|uniref:uncharacterized protein n=1 Tax=Hetaerina americana TaxID=62018 RepID=UPI003A7F5EE8